MCFKERQAPGWCLILWSSLVLIIGLAFTYAASHFLGLQNEDGATRMDGNMGYSVPLYITAAIFVLLALFGICGVLTKTRCCVVCTGCASLPIIFLIIFFVYKTVILKETAFLANFGGESICAPIRNEVLLQHRCKAKSEKDADLCK